MGKPQSQSSRRLAHRVFTAIAIAALAASITSLAFDLGSEAKDVNETLTISSSSDDARSPDGGGYSDNETWMMVGAGNGSSPNIAGFRFTEVMIPAGAVIDAVEFSLVKGTSARGRFVVDLAFEDTANSRPFTVVQTPAFRSLTSEKSRVNDNQQYRAGRRYSLGSSSELAASLQRIIAKPDWQVGNSVALIAYGPANPAWARHDFLTRDAGSRNSPQLKVTYHVPAGEVPGNPPDDNAGSAMVVKSIDVTVQATRGYRITAVVDVVSNGTAVQGALVAATFSAENGRSGSMSARTNNQGRATFSSTTTEQGTFVMEVTGVTHPELEFNPTGGAELTTTFVVGESESPSTPTETSTAPATETSTETPTHDHEPSPTETSTETATETATETSTSPSQDVPPFPYGQWQPPSDHDNGDPPPQWVTGWIQQQAAIGVPGFYSVGLIYGGDEQTSGEWVNKPRAFKAYAATIKGVDIYWRYHSQSNPMGHSARFHSYEIYARDPSGNVSFWQGWFDYGTGNHTLPTVRDEDCETDLPRPIMLVNKPGCGEYTFENWYSKPGGTGPGSGWIWDTGLNMRATYFHAGEPHHMDTWQRAPDGNNGLTRRIELAWYAERSGMAPKGEWFWATQFGTIVSGPDDPLCSTSRTFGEKTYEVKCLPQYISPTMPTVNFPGNADQKSFDCPECTMPN